MMKHFVIPVLAAAAMAAQEKDVLMVAPQAATVQWMAAGAGSTASLSPVTGAPFAADGVTEFTQTLGDGTRISRKTTSRQMRDSQGRTRNEQFGPPVGPMAPALEAIAHVFIHDPVAKETYILNEKDKTAEKLKFPGGPVGGVFRARATRSSAPEPGVKIEEREVVMFNEAVPAPPPGGPAGARVLMLHDESSEDVQRESLGEQTISGVMCEGTRLTHTIPAGQIGNDRPLKIVTEAWKSAELKMDVMRRTQDPLNGETTFKLENIRRAEPAKSLFQIPADYTVREGGPGQFMRIRQAEPAGKQ